MERQKLTAELRSEFKKSHTRALRRDGQVPGTVYGKKVDHSYSVQVPLADLKACLQTEAGDNAIIDLSIPDNGLSALPVMVSKLQFDPRTRRLLHVDFHTVAMDEKITTTVPVHLIGEAEGVKNQGGMLDHLHRELQIQALPTNIPPRIDLDITELQIGDAIKIGDIKVPDVEFMGPEDDPVVMIRVATVSGPLPEEAEAAETAGEEQTGAPAQAEEATAG
ncbi:MAG: 50S ribosomal protein L25 [Armatimonadetes bacterium]|nr:50S ribosomal protein L25 [Armatimonadota bacterium]